MEKTKILIVEDDMIIAANISLQLSNLGYEVTGIETKAKEAIHHALETKPDLILMDVQLKGESNGIDAAHAIRRYLDIPLIYLTANVDDATFQKAKETHPFAFIAKPFTNLNLERTIALVEEKILEKRAPVSVEDTFVDSQEDRIFIRNNNKLVKVMLDEILYVEADRNYCKIFTVGQTYLIVSPMNKLCEKIDSRRFIRIHRSFVVNFSRLEAVAESYVEINGKLIPIGKQYKEELHRMMNKV
ncbi:LytR/AlgR family response regulator transcription factor [Algoriphagus boritolerans]|uniref:Two component transcriptional regulator, LytTR family n=1 Tax=Algoriphagus boritolerans DSM 17298 = JCM 18970 TaxID=1120964 RepID=A0A1H5VCI5_9BACT|nr:response regulator [Algoriphagus boritolerans]SEF85029.1 two component transcriptional regulator, LytTR family [Algoriphagus boritolerans DSM 17298 = JCM 18970]